MIDEPSSEGNSTQAAESTECYRWPCGEPREALDEDMAWTIRLGAREAADRDVQSDRPVETGQVSEVASIPAMDAAGVGTAVGAGCGRSGDRHVDGQSVDVQNAIDQATLGGSVEEFEWNQ